MWVLWDLQAHRDLQVTLVLLVHLLQVSFTRLDFGSRTYELSASFKDGLIDAVST